MQLGLRHVQAYLLLLPAFVFLVGFTHYPAVGTLIDSLMSTPRAGRAAVFVGLDNYAVMIDDPTFWKSLRNNFWFASLVRFVLSFYVVF